MKTTNKMTEVIWEQITFLVEQIIALKKKEKDYNQPLATLTKLFVKEEIFADLSLMELYGIEMHVFHNILNKAEELEKYELCDQLLKVIQFEKDLYLEWIMSMTDEDLKDESLEEYNFTNIYFQNYKNI